MYRKLFINYLKGIWFLTQTITIISKLIIYINYVQQNCFISKKMFFFFFFFFKKKKKKTDYEKNMIRNELFAILFAHHVLLFKIAPC